MLDELRTLLAQCLDKRRLIDQVALDDLDSIDDVGDALERCGARATGHPDDAIALFEQEFGQIGAVLPGNSGNKCSFRHCGSLGVDRRGRDQPMVSART